MMNYKKLLTAFIAMALTCNHLSAQNNDLDLNTQRSETQDVFKIPGKVLNHQGLIINPTPHTLQRQEGTLNISGGIALKDKKNKFGDDLTFLTFNKKGVKMSIDFGEKIATRQGIKNITGSYSLTINEKGITIVGYDEKGAYYAIRTLHEIIQSPISAGGNLPCLSISDYPDLPYRGVVEGFYGTPWSHKVRLSLIDLYGRYKMNYYLYGPKDDPYHSCPNWRKPYPEKEAANIKELVEACNRNRVDFVWAIHPGQDIKWNEEDYKNLMNKFSHMYDLGVRAFAIFFDDISGEGTNPLKQTEWLNRLNKELSESKSGVSPLIVCPTDYTKLWANPTPKGSLVTYGNTLDSTINVFWTGDYVCSDLTPSTMKWVNSRIKRPALYWWNFPVTDYARHIIMQGPAYGLDTTLTSRDVCGLISNPMEHGEASKLSLYSVADYSWNIAAYNPLDSWERGLAELASDAKEAYRTFAIHSCDTEKGYRRIESWETKTFRIDNYTQADYDALLEEFKKIAKVPAEMEAKCTNKALLTELRPWLTEFGKLGIRGQKVLRLLEQSKSCTPSEFWEAYLSVQMTPEEVQAYKAHRSGTMKLQPFYEQTMHDLLCTFYKGVTGILPDTSRNAQCPQHLTIVTTDSVQAQTAFDNNPHTTFENSGTLLFTLPEGSNQCIVISNPQATTATVKQLSAKKKILKEEPLDASVQTIRLVKDAVKIEIQGNCLLHEIILIK